jgi:two-component system OmpR family response regulator
MTSVLIVDDDPDIRLLLRLELSAEGYEIFEAGDGEAGLAALEDHTPDVVLLDMMMPILDGWGVLRAIDHSSAPPIVVVTALTTRDEHHQAELIELGAFDIVMKPFDPGWLVDLVDQALHLDQAGRDAYRQSRLDSFRRGPGAR